MAKIENFDVKVRILTEEDVAGTDTPVGTIETSVILYRQHPKRPELKMVAAVDHADPGEVEGPSDDPAGYIALIIAELFHSLITDPQVIDQPPTYDPATDR